MSKKNRNRYIQFDGYKLRYNKDGLLFNSREIKSILWHKNPRCVYCNQLTYLPTHILEHNGKLKLLINSKPYPDYLATLDHVYSRLNPERNIGYNKYKVVLACSLCNNYRARLEEDKLSIEELHQRSGRSPSQSKTITDEEQTIEADNLES